MVIADLLPASFRDPSGSLFRRDGELYRQVNQVYAEHYDHLLGSGLYQRLVERELLVEHEAAENSLALTGDAYKILKPQTIPFISYPFEWCFEQLKAAALLTLEIQQIAFSHGMVLKDASAYNVQFVGSMPIFIDSLSFEIYQDNVPWAAYRQFCQHFLAPLVLISYRDSRLMKLLQTNIDGIPLDLASDLAPLSAKCRPSIFAHLVWHALAQKRHANFGYRGKSKVPKISKLGFQGLIDNLKSTVENLKWQHPATEWGDYYEQTNYRDHSMEHKASIVKNFLNEIGHVDQILDLGANTGRFSGIASLVSNYVVAADIDPVAVDLHYRSLTATKDRKVLPLLLDINSPTPGVGWGNSERDPFLERAKGSTVVALALIHHVCISNNVPMARFADLLASISESLIIEFVPKSDSQVARLLATRADIFPDYHLEGFEKAFSSKFRIIKRQAIRDSERTLFCMARA